MFLFPIPPFSLSLERTVFFLFFFFLLNLCALVIIIIHQETTVALFFLLNSVTPYCGWFSISPTLCHFCSSFILSIVTNDFKQTQSISRSSLFVRQVLSPIARKTSSSLPARVKKRKLASLFYVIDYESP